MRFCLIHKQSDSCSGVYFPKFGLDHKGSNFGLCAPPFCFLKLAIFCLIVSVLSSRFDCIPLKESEKSKASGEFGILLLSNSNISLPRNKKKNTDAFEFKTRPIMIMCLRLE